MARKVNKRKLVECVPNFSEGRRPEVVRAIADAIMAVPGIRILRQESDPDHNRSVITFAGEAQAVEEAAICSAGAAAALIDLNKHEGVHPRIGAADVVPFVPLAGATMADCVAMAHRAGRQIWERYGVPVYYYEEAARLPERRSLAEVRHGNFEGLRQELAESAERAPDEGDGQLHPTAGATVVGARQFLIAWNVNLATADLDLARRIARTIRASSGGLPFVRALGLPLASRGQVQISMNLTNFHRTGMHEVLMRIEDEARRAGVSIADSELIGLVPRAALEEAAAHYLRFGEFDRLRVVENAVDDDATLE
jgi:glutamate formiminotransferase